MPCDSTLPTLQLTAGQRSGIALTCRDKSVIAGGTTGTATTCSVTARLEQLEDPSSVPLNLTSNQFRIGVARDMVPD